MSAPGSGLGRFIALDLCLTPPRTLTGRYCERKVMQVTNLTAGLAERY